MNALRWFLNKLGGVILAVIFGPLFVAALSKGLSVNNFNFSPTDDGGGKTDEGLVTLRKLLVADQELPKPIEPGVGGLDHPPSVLRRSPSAPLLPADTRAVAPFLDRDLCGLPGVAFIGV